MLVDESGNWPEWLDKFISDVRTDISNFDINNTSEDVVLNSNYFSFYKGKLVLRINGDRSGSFGILFITRETNRRANPQDVVRHEYGHTVQMDQLGVIDYLLCIGIPSYFEWGSDPNYYRRPWEITADIYGGVRSRSYPYKYIQEGFDYLENSKKWGIFVWLFI